MGTSGPLLHQRSAFRVRLTEVSLTACDQAHAEQMRHVEKGCLVRTNQNIPSDGSRIEGSHKGWNSLQRSFSSGVEVFTALSHDFVLRRNVRVATSRDKSTSFVEATYGSHHIGLMNHVHALWNAHVKKDKSGTIEELPKLQDVNSKESFGLVKTRHVEAYATLSKIKDDEGSETAPLPHEILDEDDILTNLNIDPSLRHQPACGHVSSGCEQDTVIEPEVSHHPLHTQQNLTYTVNGLKVEELEHGEGVCGGKSRSQIAVKSPGPEIVDLEAASPNLFVPNSDSFNNRLGAEVISRANPTTGTLLNSPPTSTHSSAAVVSGATKAMIMAVNPGSGPTQVVKTIPIIHPKATAPKRRLSVPTEEDVVKRPRLQLLEEGVGPSSQGALVGSIRIS